MQTRYWNGSDDLPKTLEYLTPALSCRYKFKFPFQSSASSNEWRKLIMSYTFGIWFFFPRVLLLCHSILGPPPLDKVKGLLPQTARRMPAFPETIGLDKPPWRDRRCQFAGWQSMGKKCLLNWLLELVMAALRLFVSPVTASRFIRLSQRRPLD